MFLLGVIRIIQKKFSPVVPLLAPSFNWRTLLSWFSLTSLCSLPPQHFVSFWPNWKIHYSSSCTLFVFSLFCHVITLTFQIETSVSLMHTVICIYSQNINNVGKQGKTSMYLPHNRTRVVLFCLIRLCL